MLYGLVTSHYTQFVDKEKNIQYSDFTFDSLQYQEAKIIVAYPFLQQQIVQKLPDLKITFYTLQSILTQRNNVLFPEKEKLTNNVFLEINLDSFDLKVFYQTNEGVEVIQNKEFESTFTPTNGIEDEYYLYLKQFNQIPQFQQAMNLECIKTFAINSNPQQLYNNICQNFIADQIITNLALGGVYVVSQNFKQLEPLFVNYVKDRPYFLNFFKNLAIVIRNDYISLFDQL